MTTRKNRSMMDEDSVVSTVPAQDLQERLTEETKEVLTSDSTEQVPAVPSALSSTENNDTPQGSEKEYDDDEEYESVNPLENIIPLEKIKNGWGLIWTNIKSKAQEISTSETVMSIKQETQHFFQKSTTVLAPAFERAKIATVETVQYSWDKTKEFSEKARPHFESAAQAVVDVAEKGAVATAEGIQHITNKLKEQTAPSVSAREAKGFTI